MTDKEKLQKLLLLMDNLRSVIYAGAPMVWADQQYFIEAADWESALVDSVEKINAFEKTIKDDLFTKAQECDNQ